MLMLHLFVSAGFLVHVCAASPVLMPTDQELIQQAKQYTTLSGRILSGDVAESDAQILEAIHLRSDEASRSIAMLKKALSAENLMDRDAAIGGLHVSLMTAQPNPDLLYGHLLRQFNRLKCDSPDSDCTSRRYWPWLYEAEAAVIAYERTGQRRFLDLVLDAYENLLTLRGGAIGREDEIRRRVLNTWGSMMPDRSKTGRAGRFYTNELTTAGTVVMPAALALRALQRTSGLSNEDEARIERLAATMLEALNEFEDDFRPLPDHDGGLYLMPYESRVEPLNHSHIVGRAYLLLHEITGDEHSLARATQLCNTFRAACEELPDKAWAWPYRYEPDRGVVELSEPIWKGATTLRLPKLAEEMQVVFTRGDMQCIARTFVNHVWLGDDRFSKYVSDAGRKRPETLAEGVRRYEYRDNGYGLLIWIFLDEYDSRIRNIVEDAVSYRPDLIARGWFGLPQGVLAYAYRLADVDDDELTHEPEPSSILVNGNVDAIIPRIMSRKHRIKMIEAMGDQELRQTALSGAPSSTLLYGYLDDQFGHRFEDDIRLRRMNRDSWSDVAALLRATLVGYERTGESRFADLFIRQFDRLYSCYSSLENQQEFASTLRISLPALQFAGIIANAPDATPQHRDAARRIATTIDGMVSRIHPKLRDEDAVGDVPSVYAGRGRAVRVRDLALAALVHAHLGVLTDSPGHRAVSKQLTELFVDEVVLDEDGAIWWPEWAGKAADGPIWDASETMLLPLMGGDLGLEGLEEVRQGLSPAFMNHIRRGNREFGRTFSNTPGDDRLVEAVRPKGYSARNVYGLLAWMALAEDDPAIADVLEDAVLRRFDLYPHGWIGDPRGALAYAYRLPLE